MWLQGEEKRNLFGNQGLTLIEVLIVVIIIFVFAAVAVPTVSGYIEKTKEDVCMVNARISISYLVVRLNRYYEVSIGDG